ncbi:beta-lactamase family protein [Bacillus sp. FJAT-49705]|uniref:Beta-lactamase family protein n=1 Tax=Cytobacillus citreus TaxID=2833586 RepID=A0ABS5NQ63_9BACI|nr:serine hydrolase domain-containing protein [Cytobacillus citreus]MBS4189956.1 beta-lactamase family protein [Cytobacillus citreus]
MVKNYLQQLVEDRHIPGAVLYISKNKETKFFQSFGSFLDKNNQQQLINQDTIFDVASLTKVMATLPSILLLASKKEIDLESSIHSFLPAFKNKDITINHLLQHRSGLPADLPFQDRNTQRDVMQEILDTKLINTPGTTTLYSDLGMILLGKVIEKVSGQQMHVFTKENIFEPWGLYDTTYLLPDEKKKLAASTEWYKDQYIQGDVHDEKAFQLSGVSGSAGVFSTAKDVAAFASKWLYPEEQDLIPQDFLREAATHRQNNRGLGFEVWSGAGESLSIGELWPIGSFGHTGFTGTSVWMSPSEKIAVVFLTNAVHFGRETTIKKIRK